MKKFKLWLQQSLCKHQLILDHPTDPSIAKCVKCKKILHKFTVEGWL